MVVGLLSFFGCLGRGGGVLFLLWVLGFLSVFGLGFFEFVGLGFSWCVCFCFAPAVCSSLVIRKPVRSSAAIL